MIEVTNLTKVYGDKRGINNISFHIGAGEIVGFLGPNGAGKSTTMNIITGYLGLTEGEVIIDGHSVADEPDAVRRSIGYLPEQPPLYMDMTVGEYLAFAAELKKIPAEDRPGSVIEVMELGPSTLFVANVVEAKVLSSAPSATYSYYHAHIKPKKNPAPEQKECWVCKVCGYVYEGAELPDDFICPLCKHGKDDFEHIVPAQKQKQKGWVCTICGHFEPCEGELPPDYVCPLCKHGAADFEPIE